MTVPSLFSEDDLFLLAEGTWLGAYEKLGAHPRVVAGTPGTNFAVWAPGATHVAVELYGPVGRGASEPMAPRGNGGVWECFLPGVGVGAVYKYAITSRFLGYHVDKTDPYGFFTEVRPATASIVYDLAGYSWQDHDWMVARSGQAWATDAMSIYEVHLGSWRRGPGGTFLTYRELAHELVPYVQQLGFTHVELLPITEHPTDASWGYQPAGYFAPTSRHGTPHDLMYFVDFCHRHRIGVLIDWVPGHFAKEGHGLGFFDGTHLYEHADPRRGEHLTWGTFVFNFERHEVVTFLLSSAHYWLHEYHVDGLRVDAVSSMLYADYDRNEGGWVANRYGGRENLEAVTFLRRVNDVLHERHPGVVTCAEEATTWPGLTRPTDRGGLGFDLKWNMGWMNDTLNYLARDPLDRLSHHFEFTFPFTFAFSERYLLPLSHDEVVHLKHSLLNKMPGERWQQFATLRALFGSMFAHPGKKLLFMGAELAQEREWAYAEALEWYLLDGPAGRPHRQIQSLVATLNRLYAATPALHQADLDPSGFAWIDGSDAAHAVVVTERRSGDATSSVVVVSHWTPVPQPDYRIGVPRPGAWRLLLNTDDEAFGGLGMPVLRSTEAEPVPHHGRSQSVTLTLPPLCTLWLEPDAGSSAAEQR